MNLHPLVAAMMGLDPRFGPSLLFISLAILTVTGCQMELVTPPRLATAEAISVQPATPRAEPLYLPAPTATGSATARESYVASSDPGLSIWVNETSADHRNTLDLLAKDFSARTGIDLAVQFVDPALMPELAQTAVLSNTLPDIILHPLEFSVAWSEAGILDASAANNMIEDLGRSTFNQDALALVEVDGQNAAIPTDGYQQLWLYRSDWFEEAGLAVPDSYAALQAGAETLYDPDDLVYGLVIPTESNLINTHRAFEHLALANNCQLFSSEGEILLLEPECRDALNFYYGIVNQFSPPGVQTDTSARNAFLDGRTAIIMSGPDIIADLVRTNRLDRNTGIVTRLKGENSADEGAGFANITYVGVTPVAERESAASFVNYWFNEGYQTWLAVETERKIPMRLGTPDRPSFYIDAWGSTPVLEGESLDDIVGEQILAQLRDGTESAERWGFAQGQGALMGKIYEEMTFPIVLQEMLSGYFSSAKTIFEAYNRVIDLIPDYTFPIIPTPEA